MREERDGIVTLITIFNICPKSILGTQIYTAFSSTTVYYSTQSRVFILKGDVPSGPPLPLPRIFGG